MALRLLQMDKKLQEIMPAFVPLNKNLLHYTNSQIPLLHILSTKNTVALKSCSI